MIFGFDTENNKHGDLTVACLAGRSTKLVLGPGPAHMGEFHHHLYLQSKIEDVMVWSINLEYDLINFYGGKMPDFLNLVLGRHKIVGAKMRGERIRFFGVEKFIPRKSAAEVGIMLKYKKFVVKIEDVLAEGLPKDKLERYCMRDAQIARKAGEAIVGTLARCGVNL